MNSKSHNKEGKNLLTGHGLPNYEGIGPDEINNQMPQLLEDINNELSRLEEELNAKMIKDENISWEDIIPPIQTIEERLRWSWGIVSHLNGVLNSKLLRDSYTKYQPEVIRFTNRLGQSKIIYNCLIKVNESAKSKLDNTKQRILESEILAMKQLGIGLDQTSQTKFNNISEKLANLSNNFSNNLLDATQDWTLLLTKNSEVEGLPQRALEILSESAKQYGDLNQLKEEPSAEKGPWRLGLDMPRYIPFMTHGKNEEIRELLYKAYVKRASEGKFNNQPLISQILELRGEQANQLGFPNWASVSLIRKMAKDIKQVEELLEELRSASFPKAQKEFEELLACAQRHSKKKLQSLAPWDVSYWSEKLRQEKFQLNHEALRPWFPMPQVLKGLFSLCNRLFEITIESSDGEAPIWHKDVKYFNVKDKNGSKIASFYLDPYSRPENKRGGAWMDECLIRERRPDKSLQLPVAYLICNQTPPIGNTPSLMSFEEVETLFHEFGHGLQHMLTTVEQPKAAGINNVEWDAVELPSQFMENWCLDRRTMLDIARHWQTNEPLPEEEFEKLRKSRTFNSGLATLRQVHLALTDLRLHSSWKPNQGLTPDQLRRQIAKNTTVLPPIKDDQFLCSFSHIFSGGYAAGYYSYKWAEVLSADAFAAFEEVGLDQEKNIKETGKRFRETILSQGGSRSPNEIFKSFRGRMATSKALIRHHGLK